MNVNHDPKILVALDFPDELSALNLAAKLDPSMCRLKVGKEMFTRYGPALVESLQKQGFDIFLDLKFHDIPNTVAGACCAAASLGVWMINVHCLGGRKMLEAAAEAVAGYQNRPLLTGVTILTSMGEQDIREIGLQSEVSDQVENLSRLAAESGLDGVVCSPQEITQLREKRGKEFLLVTPGIRPAGSASHDQKRIMTPREALELGSNYLVIGRPITQADNPQDALKNIIESIG